MHLYIHTYMYIYILPKPYFLITVAQLFCLLTSHCNLYNKEKNKANTELRAPDKIIKLKQLRKTPNIMGLYKNIVLIASPVSSSYILLKMLLCINYTILGEY